MMLLLLPAAVQAQWHCQTKGNANTVIRYTGSDREVQIPDKINRLPVNSIGKGAFYACTNLTQVVIPASVTNIENRAFWYCPKLTRVIFIGNAPIINQYVFDGDSKAIIIYSEGTTGWGKTFGGRPTEGWSAKPFLQPPLSTSR